MVTSTRVSRHSTSADLHLSPSGVLTVTMRGPLTGQALQFVKGEVVRLYAGQVRGFIVDYRRAVIALSGADLDAVLEKESKDSPAGMPAAMLIQPEDEPLFRSHARRMGARGMARRIFSEPQLAQDWLSSRLTDQSPG